MHNDDAQYDGMPTTADIAAMLKNLTDLILMGDPGWNADVVRQELSLLQVDPKKFATRCARAPRSIFSNL